MGCELRDDFLRSCPVSHVIVHELWTAGRSSHD